MQQRYVVGKARRRIRLEDASPRVDYSVSALIDFLRGKENARIFLKKLGESRDIATITAPTIMEIISGAELEESKREKKEILNLLNTLTILPLDESSSILAGEIEAKLAMVVKQFHQ